MAIPNKKDMINNIKIWENDFNLVKINKKLGRDLRAKKFINTDI